MSWHSGKTIMLNSRTVTASHTSTQDDVEKEINALGIMTMCYLKTGEPQGRQKEREAKVMRKARAMVRQKDGNPKEKTKAKAKASTGTQKEKERVKEKGRKVKEKM